MMKALLALALVTSSSLAFADQGPLHKDIQKEIVKTHREIQQACGCGVTFSYDRDLDFTSENGRSLAYNVEKTVDDIGTRSVHWCNQGDDFRGKYCAMVKSVEVSQDTSTKRPYTRAVGPGVVRSYIAAGNPKQLSNHGGAWVQKFLQTGRMPERKPD